MPFRGSAVMSYKRNDRRIHNELTQIRTDSNPSFDTVAAVGGPVSDPFDTRLGPSGLFVSSSPGSRRTA